MKGLRKPHPLLGRLASLAMALAFAGCSGSTPWRALITKPVPRTEVDTTTPERTVRSLEWCWDHRDFERYRELLTADFVFACASTDTAGNAFRDHGLTRFDELESARHLFVGGGQVPPAKGIRLELDRHLVPQQDRRPGKQDTSYHQVIITSVVLDIDTDASDYSLTGAARFFLVRGDSALIPAELVARGFRPDAGRWYVERWEDETGGLPAAQAAVRNGRGTPSLAPQPSGNFTWCALKRLYR